MSNKKIRGGRTTDKQFAAMLDFFNENIGLADGKYSNSSCREEMKAKWNEMSVILNNIRGARKTGEQWRTAWRDLKCRTICKAKNCIWKDGTFTDSIENRESVFSDIEIRVIDILGFNDSDKYNSRSYNTSEDEDMQDPCPIFNGDNLDCNIKEEKMFETEANSFVELIINKSPNCSSESSAVNSEVAQTSSRKQNLKQKSNLINRRKDSVEKPQERLPVINEQFSKISKAHANALEALAESSKLQATAMDRIAAAMEKQTEALTTLANNDAKRLEVLEKITDVFTKFVPQYLQHSK